jgi:secreted trypsin-like serine protease
MNRKPKQIIKVAFILMILLISIMVIRVVQNSNLANEDASAIYGGEEEWSYFSAGYLISENKDGSFNYCSATSLNDGLAITAAHCVQNSEKIYLGFGGRTFSTFGSMQVKEFYINSGWDGQDIRYDFAVLLYENPQDLFVDNAEILSPAEGCNYRVVGYGKTSQDDEQGVRPRQGADICIERIEGDNFYIQGETSGICTGDSGSPIYVKDTNFVVGVISSIVLEAGGNERDACSLQNTAVAVRADNMYFDYEQSKTTSYVEYAVDEQIQEPEDDQFATELINEIEQSRGFDLEKYVEENREEVMILSGLVSFVAVISIALILRGKSA